MIERRLPKERPAPVGLGSSHEFVEPLLQGARVLEVGAVSIAGPASAFSLHDRGAASVVSLDGDAAAIAAAREQAGGPGLSFWGLSTKALAPASFELAIIHDLSWLLGEGRLAELKRLLAPQGQALIVSPVSPVGRDAAGEGRDRAAARYRELAASLQGAFDSVEVVVERSIAGIAFLPANARAPGMIVDDRCPQGDGIRGWHFLCGEEASCLREQQLILSPALDLEREREVEGLRRRCLELEGEAQTLRAAMEELQGEAQTLRAAMEELQGEAQTLRAAMEELEGEAQTLRAALEERGEEVRALRSTLEERGEEPPRLSQEEELEALEEEAERARFAARSLRTQLAEQVAPLPSDWPFGTRVLDDDDLMRLLREAQESAESARLHAREAEGRLRSAEQRAEEAESERAKSALAARQYRAEAESLRRSIAASPFPGQQQRP